MRVKVKYSTVWYSVLYRIKRSMQEFTVYIDRRIKRSSDQVKVHSVH